MSEQSDRKLVEFHAGMDKIRQALIKALAEIDVPVTTAEITYAPKLPNTGHLPDWFDISVGPKGAAVVTHRISTEQIEDSAADLVRAGVGQWVRQVVAEFRRGKIPPR